MAAYTYPFVAMRSKSGVILRPPSAYLPVRITNPHTGDFLRTYALVDTGADACAFPSTLAQELSHNFRGPGVQASSTLGVSGMTDVYEHTFDIVLACMCSK